MTAVPASFGKYFLTAKLATGGMAEIYLAKLIGPSGFEKRLVIKQIHPQFSREAQFVDLFVAEAKTLVSLSHGNIVPIYELGVVDDIYFIAMEYIDGPTLERLERTMWRHGDHLEPRFAAYIGGEILKGLDYAHRKTGGVIHRDLSPRNVMVSREGEVKLVDFGLAVHAEARQLSRGAGGRPAGSFPYMSPEQVRGDKLDTRSDIFSAGVLLWEMLAGRPLFARPDPDETLEAVLEAEIPPPSERNPEVPDELDEICLRALERDREARYQTAAKFLRPLSRYLYSSEAVVGPAELSRLLATACPPSNRERVAASPADEEPEHDAGDEGKGGREREEGEHLGGTVVMPGRESAASEKPPRAETIQTFATNAVWREELREAGAESPEADGSGEIEPSVAPAPPRSWTTAAALAAAVGFAILAAVAWFRSQAGNRAATRAPVQVADAATPALALPDAAPPRARDAGLATARLADAAAPPPADAGRQRVVHRQRDAAARPPTPSGKGTIEVGALPWAEVSIDGKKVGSAPDRFQVPAGRHRVTLTFQGRTHSWNVELADGDKKSLFFDFGGGD